MSIIAALLVAVVAAEHGYILVMEMFLWRTARVQAIFGVTPEFAESTVALAANQGLYNGFLAAGLLWSLVSAPHGFALKVFFLGCAIVAGVYGGATVKTRILWVQALPAALAIAATLIWG